MIGGTEDGYGWNRYTPLDAFSKSEKWLSPAPSPNVDAWKSRDLEILGWAEYSSQLVAWAAQGSEEFANEISHAVKWHCPTTWDSLTKPQKSRGTRLFSILKSAFSSHPRTNMIIAAFSEGLNVQGGLPSFALLTEGELKSNGFELLRQLTQEFSLRSRAEALSLRTSLAAKSFSLSANETTVSTVVSDTIRKLDFECNRYTRLISTLPNSVDSTGLSLPESDMLMILLRSLPATVRDFCLHHSTGETFQDYKRSAKRWEEQQRLFQELHGTQGHGKRVSQVNELGRHATEWYVFDDPNEENTEVNAVFGDKCTKCGSKKHKSDACTVDLTKIKCFSCGGSGHIGANCPEKRRGASNQVNQGGKWSKGKAEGKGKGGKSGKGKEASKGGKSSGGKGKSKGFGKKGKLNETVETDPADMWYEESDWWFDADWNTWVTSAMQESWDESEEWFENSAQADGTQGTSEANSLIISMMIADELEETGLFVEGSGSEGFEKKCRSVFCSCSECVLKDSSFSCAWSTHRMKLNEEKSKGSVLEESVLQDDFSHSTVLQDVCEPTSCFPTKVPSCLSGLYGLKGPTGFSGGSEDLVSQFHGKLTVFKTKFDTFLNHCDTCSKFSEFVRYSHVVMPLLSQMTMDDSSWWLLDSGASATVLAERFATAYGIRKNSGGHQGDKFKAANGTAVNMSGKAEFGVKVVMVNEWGTERSHRNAQLKAMIGDIQHNIISTTSLCKAGWEFWQGDTWFELRNKKTGEVASETGYFAGCPWIRLQACPNSKVVSFVEGEPDSNSSRQLAPLTRATEAALPQHRLQGHVPYDPRCLECTKGKTTFQHRRRKENLLESELQADFAFISSRGELTDDEVDHCYKVLVLSELSSTCVGYILITSDLVSVRTNLVKWLDHMGLSSGRASIVLHTDSERAVSELVTKVSDRFVFTVRRAAPQQHRSVGHAERAVRRLKESLAVIRSDLNKASVDIAFSNESLGEVLTYLGLVHNHYFKAPGFDLSPLEFVAGRNLSKPVTALYGMNVLAEIPQSQRQGSPNESRNVEAMFLHHGLGTGAVVQAMIRHDGEMKLGKFVARNLKTHFPFFMGCRQVWRFTCEFGWCCWGFSPTVARCSNEPRGCS